MSFKQKIANKKMIGNRKIDADNALGIHFKDIKDAKLIEVELTILEENPFQPRVNFTKESLEELVESIRYSGLLQPIVIRVHPQDSKRFQIVAGHRRTQAHKELGKNAIKAIVVQASDEELQINALIENIQREELSVLDEANAYFNIINNLQKKQTDVAQSVGKSQAHISKMLKILTLNEGIIQDLKDTNIIIPVSVLSEISYVKDKTLQLKIYERIKKENLKRQEVRELIARLTKKPDAKPEPLIAGLDIKKARGSVSFKIMPKKITDKKRVIKELEDLIQKLKNDESL